MSQAADDGTSSIAIGAVLAWLGLQGAGAGAAVLLTFATLSITFTLVFGLPFDDRALDQRSLTCTGRLTEVEPTPNYQINSEGTVVLYFDCPDLSAHDDWKVRVVESDPIADLRPGDPVIVEYLPDDPGVARIQGSRAAPAGWVGLVSLVITAFSLLLCLVTAVVPFAGIAMIVDGLRRRRRGKAAVPASNA